MEKQILTNFAFPASGTYWVKAVLTMAPSVHGQQKVESAPIKIVINELDGADLAVWKRIKDRADFASFLPRGSFLASEEKVEASLLDEVREIVRTYPHSKISMKMQTRLEKFQTMEQKRNKILDRAKVPGK